MHLRILSSVILMEMFDLQGNELKCRKQWSWVITIVITMFCEVAGHVWVDLKLKLRTSYVRYSEVIYTKQQNTRLQ